MKRIISIVLFAAMLFTLMVPAAFAAGVLCFISSCRCTF